MQDLVMSHLFFIVLLVFAGTIIYYAFYSMWLEKKNRELREENDKFEAKVKAWIEWSTKEGDDDEKH